MPPPPDSRYAAARRARRKYISSPSSPSRSHSHFRPTSHRYHYTHDVIHSSSVPRVARHSFSFISLVTHGANIHWGSSLNVLNRAAPAGNPGHRSSFIVRCRLCRRRCDAPREIETQATVVPLGFCNRIVAPAQADAIPPPVFLSKKCPRSRWGVGEARYVQGRWVGRSGVGVMLS